MLVHLTYNIHKVISNKEYTALNVLFNVKLNSLRQWQRVAKVDGIRLTPHIGFPRIRA
jgi:hypothetical protein